jgi:YggT family protein
VGELICTLLNVYVLIVFARIILSWFPLQPGGAAAQVFSVTYTLTEPVLGPLRRTIPSIGMFDLSPIVVILGARVLCSILPS